MTNRILVGGVVGGVVLFIWSFVSHVLLPLGEVGIQPIPNEEPVLEAMRAAIHEPGLYFFPGLAPGRERDEAAMKQWEEKAKRGPTGILVYHVHGEGMLPPKALGTELGSNIALALLAAFLLSHIGGSLLLRAGKVGLMGLIAGLDVYISFWNWYGFPANWTIAIMSDQLIGILLMGVALAAIVKKQ